MEGPKEGFVGGNCGKVGIFLFHLLEPSFKDAVQTDCQSPPPQLVSKQGTCPHST